MHDAAEGIHELKKAVRNARQHDPLYADPDISDGDRWNELVDGPASAASEPLKDEVMDRDEEFPPPAPVEEDPSNPSWNN